MAAAPPASLVKGLRARKEALAKMMQERCDDEEMRYASMLAAQQQQLAGYGAGAPPLPTGALRPPSSRQYQRHKEDYVREHVGLNFVR